MIWKGSWLHTQRIKVRRLPILPFPHTPQTGDRIPIGRPSRKLWWKSEQTTSSWLVRRLPSTFTPTRPSEKKPMPFFYFLALVLFSRFWHIFIDNACLDCHTVFLVFFKNFLSGLDAPTHTCSRSPTVWVALASPTPAGWEPTTPMTCSMSLGSHSPHLWDTGHGTGMSLATWLPTGLTLPKLGTDRTSYININRTTKNNDPNFG